MISINITILTILRWWMVAAVVGYIDINIL